MGDAEIGAALSLGESGLDLISKQIMMKCLLITVL